MSLDFSSEQIHPLLLAQLLRLHPEMYFTTLPNSTPRSQEFSSLQELTILRYWHSFTPNETDTPSCLSLFIFTSVPSGSIRTWSLKLSRTRWHSAFISGCGAGEGMSLPTPTAGG